MRPAFELVGRILACCEPKLRAFLVAHAVTVIVGIAGEFGASFDELVELVAPCGKEGCDCHVRLRGVMESLRDGVHSVSKEIQSENMAREGVFAPGVPIYPKEQ